VARAVKETAWQTLHKKNRILDVEYLPICGGFAESCSAFRELQEDSYPAVFDGEDKHVMKIYGDLSQTANLKKWLIESPPVYCNIDALPKIQLPYYFSNYFRWSTVYGRHELEELISRNMGKEIGVLYDIIPLRRSVSGRIQEIEILASDTNLIIRGEKRICKTLGAERELPSSCFIVEQSLDYEGFPLTFSFVGAGFGQGGGMCQAGALSQAFSGASFDKILDHYFKGTKLKKVYEV
ncbi:MAG: hypothetical protein SCK70_03840, partial [bacterium]|nr:hypothetical protein [bacterium]